MKAENWAGIDTGDTYRVSVGEPIATPIYIAICCDRHIDEAVKVFTTLGGAIAYAKAFVRTNAVYLNEAVEYETADWLYHVIYSCEGDNVRVVRDVLDPTGG